MIFQNKTFVNIISLSFITDRVFVIHIRTIKSSNEQYEFKKKNRVLKKESGKRISENVKNIERTVYGQIKSYLEMKERVSITEMITLYVTLLNDENTRIARGTILNDYLTKG